MFGCILGGCTLTTSQCTAVQGREGTSGRVNNNMDICGVSLQTMSLRDVEEGLPLLRGLSVKISLESPMKPPFVK